MNTLLDFFTWFFGILTVLFVYHLVKTAHADVLTYMLLVICSMVNAYLMGHRHQRSFQYRIRGEKEP